MSRQTHENLLAQSYARSRWMTDSREVSSLTAVDAMSRFLDITADVGVVIGPLLKIPPFNMVPHPDFLDLGAKVISHAICQHPGVDKLQDGQIAMAGIETAGTYWTAAIAHAVAIQLGHKITPPILRIHKSKTQNDIDAPKISAVYPQSEVVFVPVSSITSRISNADLELTGTPNFNFLAMHNPGERFLKEIKMIIIVDDFQATGSSGRQSVELIRKIVRNLFGHQIDILFVSGISKLDQLESPIDAPTFSLLNIEHFQGGDEAQIVVSGHEPKPLRMHTSI